MIFARTTILTITVLFLVTTAQSQSPSAEAVDEANLPDAGADLADDGPSTGTPKATTADKKKTSYSEERFEKLFQTRRSHRKPGINPKFVHKPKPTLPSFIRNTPTLIKVQVTQSTVNPRQTARTTTTTTRSPARNRNQNQNQSNSRLTNNNNNNNNNNRRNGQSTTSTTTLSPARRRFGGGFSTTRRSLTSTTTRIPRN